MTWTADAQPWCCTNCGYWQRFPTRPTWCPVCLDHRHAVPRRGWDFRTPNDLAGRWRTVWRQIEPGLWRFTNDPQLGIGGAGYLVKRPEGNVAFEACAWYSEVALAWIAALGGVAWAAASHPHAYGGLWQLQERFGCEVSVQRHDLAWSGSFRCTWPFDDFLDLGGGLTLHHTGGHFDGYAVLHSVPRRLLFSGDALKLERSPDDPRSAEALSTYKSHVRAVPLTPVELRRYRDVFARLAFDQTWTPFEQAGNVGRTEVLALLDRLLASRPTTRSVPLSDLTAPPLEAMVPVPALDLPAYAAGGAEGDGGPEMLVVDLSAEAEPPAEAQPDGDDMAPEGDGVASEEDVT